MCLSKMFLMQKRVKDWYYTYLVESYRDGNKVKRRYIKYIGKTDLDNKIDFIIKDICAICKSKDNLTVDHIVPISKGGKHSSDNLQVLCSYCNTKKGNKL